MTSKYKNHSKIIFNAIGLINNIDQLTKALEWVSKNKSNSYIRILRATIKSMWWEEHEYNKNNFADLEWTMKQHPCKIHKSNYKGDDLTTKELNHLINISRSEKQKLFIEMLKKTGIRISELTDILLTDCIIKDNIVTINIIAKKSNLLIKKQIGIIFYRKIVKEFHGKKYLFETSGEKAYRPEYVSNQIKKQGKRINKNISAITMRRYFTTNTINNGGIGNIKESLGHKSEGVFMTYYNKATI